MSDNNDNNNNNKDDNNNNNKVDNYMRLFIGHCCSKNSS